MQAAGVFERGDWWDAGGAFRLLHDVNPLRLEWTQSVAGSLRGRRLLDVGCGGGIFAEAAADAGAVVSGLDASAEAVAAARRHAAEGGARVEYYCGDSVAALPAGVFDVVTCFEMLEHVDEPAVVVADIALRLAPGGVAAFSTINRTPRAWAVMVAALEYAARVIPPRTHEYARFIKPSELARWCRHGGLSVCDVRGLRYSFFGHYYRLSAHDTGVNYFLAARREAG